MALDVLRSVQHGLFSVGAEHLPPDLPEIDIINRCGHLLTNMHKWEWLLGPSKPLDTRAKVTISNGTTSGTSYTALNSELDNYTFLMGDAVKIDSGSSATESTYGIVSEAAGVLTLESAPGNSTADVDGTIETNAVALPSDFAGLDSYDATNALNDSLYLTTHQELLSARTNEIQATRNHYWGAITKAKNLVSGGGPPVYRLELWPTPTTSEVGIFTIIYRRKWTDLTTDTDVIPIDDWLEPFWLELVETVIRGYLEQDTMPLRHRITDLKQSELFLDAKLRDGSAAPDHGLMQGGAVQSMYSANQWHTNATTLGEPS